MKQEVNVSLFFDHDIVMKEFDHVFDELIKHSLEPGCAWSAFCDYANVVIPRNAKVSGYLPYNEYLLNEIWQNYFEMFVGKMGFFNACERIFKQSTHLFTKGVDKIHQEGVFDYKIEGYWEEPILIHKPMMVLSGKV